MALVTGGGRGIGRAVALTMARQNARIAVNYVSNREGAEKTVREIQAMGGEAMPLQANVTVAGNVKRMVEEIVRKTGEDRHLGEQRRHRDDQGVGEYE